MTWELSIEFGTALPAPNAGPPKLSESPTKVRIGAAPRGISRQRLSASPPLGKVADEVSPRSSPPSASNVRLRLRGKKLTHSINPKTFDEAMLPHSLGSRRCEMRRASEQRLTDVDNNRRRVDPGLDGQTDLHQRRAPRTGHCARRMLLRFFVCASTPIEKPFNEEHIPPFTPSNCGSWARGTGSFARARSKHLDEEGALFGALVVRAGA
jgi:hypothetical protein